MREGRQGSRMRMTKTLSTWKRTSLGLVSAAALFGQQPEPVTLTYKGTADAGYQVLLKQLKVDGSVIDSASVDAGIQTKVVVQGKRKQSATYMKFTFIQDADNRTT